MPRGLFSQLISSFLLLAACSLGAMASTDPADRDVLKKADEARGNVGGVSWKVSLTTQEGGRASSLICAVWARGFDIFATVLAPPKYGNSKILMLKGNLWFYKFGTSGAVPISTRQKLMGKAVYADIAATNYAEDYEATRLPADTVQGEPCYVFDLKAKSKECTYDRVVYWVSMGRLVGVKADYYTLSGKKIKSCRMEYANTVYWDGQKRPFISSIEISDELMTGGSTLLKFENPVLQSVPDYLFDLNLLAK